MKTIEYKTHRGKFITPCPTRREWSNGIYVGSGICCNCPFYVRQNTEEQILECKADELLIERKTLSKKIKNE